MNPQITTRHFWLGLRERTSVNGKLGKGKCNVWCSEVLGLLREEGRGNLMESYRLDGKVDAPWLGKICNFHEWLEFRELGRRFIADGTAGQFDDVFMNGYYGFLDSLPTGELKRIYTHKKVKPGMGITRLRIEYLEPIIEVNA